MILYIDFNKISSYNKQTIRGDNMEKKYTSEDIKTILEKVVVSHQWYLTRDGKIYEPEAEEFINWLNSFTKYCFPFRSDVWKNNIRELIYNPKVPRIGVKITDELKDYLDEDKSCIIGALYHFIDAAEVMEVYATTKSWEEVARTVSNQGHSGHTFSCMRDVLLDYSLMGVEFIDRFDPDSINKDKNRKKAYIERKHYLEQIEKLATVLNDKCKQLSK